MYHWVSLPKTYVSNDIVVKSINLCCSPGHSGYLTPALVQFISFIASPFNLWLSMVIFVIKILTEEQCRYNITFFQVQQSSPRYLERVKSKKELIVRSHSASMVALLRHCNQDLGALPGRMIQINTVSHLDQIQTCRNVRFVALQTACVAC